VGWDVQYQLFDKDRYDRCIVAAARRAAASRSAAPLVEALQEARERLPSEERVAELTFGPSLFRREKLVRLMERLGQATRAGAAGLAELQAMQAEEVLPTLTESCVVWSSPTDPNQTMSAGQLPALLVEASQWLRDKVVCAGFRGGDGERLEWPHGMSGRVLLPSVVARLEEELAAVPKVRDPVARGELAEFRRLVKAARSGRGLGLLVLIG